MSTKTIPAQTIKTCDCCSVTMDGQNSRQEGKLTLNAHALDMHGHACADATRKFDLCDPCLQMPPSTQPSQYNKGGSHE